MQLKVETFPFSQRAHVCVRATLLGYWYSFVHCPYLSDVEYFGLCFSLLDHYIHQKSFFEDDVSHQISNFGPQLELQLQGRFLLLKGRVVLFVEAWNLVHKHYFV